MNKRHQQGSKGLDVYIPLLFQTVAKYLYWQNGDTSQSHNVLTYEVDAPVTGEEPK